MTASDIATKQRIEIDHWRDAENESPGSDSVHNIVNKASDASVFLHCIDRHRDKLVGHGARVLELGGGQGWASCIYKKLVPHAHVTATDISPYAVASLPQWERVFNVQVDHAYPCLSYETEERDASVDLAFCFAAAHHFLAHRRTLREVSRILKPGGRAIYFYEPVTPPYLYAMAYRRVNMMRPEVPEDVLIPVSLRRLSDEVGLQLTVDYFPSLHKRHPLTALYFLVQRRIPILQRLLPCSANLIFTRPVEPSPLRTGS